MRVLNVSETQQVSGAGNSCGGHNQWKQNQGNNGWGNGGCDGINSPKVNDGFKVGGDSSGAYGIHGGGRTKCAR